MAMRFIFHCRAWGSLRAAAILMGNDMAAAGRWWGAIVNTYMDYVRPTFIDSSKWGGSMLPDGLDVL